MGFAAFSIRDLPRWAASSVCLFAVAVAAAGCGGSVSPFKYVPVSGRCTYDDGTPLPLGGYALKFFALDAPAAGESRPRPAQARIDAEGNFDFVTSYKHADGLIPGRHRVVFFYVTDKAGKLVVPKEYTMPDSSPLIVDTKDAPLQIKVPRK